MAIIDDKVTQIRQAVYGKDVRESIAQGIEVINTEVEDTTARQNQLEIDMATAEANAIQATIEANAARDSANTAADNANTTATLADEKATLANEKATLADQKATLAQQATDNANATVTDINNNTLIVYKSWVNTYADIATTYPTPELGWTTQTKDTFTRYRWNGTEWVNIGVFTDDKIGDMGQISETNIVEAIQADRSQLADNVQQIVEISINVKHPPSGLSPAKGDGSTDDYIALQSIIDYAFVNQIGEVYFPKGTYNISYPLLVKTMYESSPIPWWSGKAIKLKGFDKSETRIVKTTNNVLTDVYSEVNGVDSALIFFAQVNSNGESGGTGTGISVKDMFIINQSNDTTAKAITGSASQRIALERLNIKSYTGIIFTNGVYSSTLRDIVLFCTENAVKLTGGCTSNILENIYSPSCKNPYVIRSAYSSMIQMYGDDCTGTVFDVSGNGLVMVSCGTESPKAQYIVASIDSKSLVNIVSLSIHRQTGDVANGLLISDCSVFYARGNIKCGSLDILENSEITGNSYLVSSSNVNYSPFFDIGRINYYKNFTGIDNPKLLYCKQKSAPTSTGRLQVEGGTVQTRANNNMPFIGIKNVENSLTSPFANKAIYLDNATKYLDSLGTDNQYQTKYNRGDILLINDPALMNILGYVVTNPGATYVRDGSYAEIPIVLRGTTAERPTSNTFIGLMYFDTTLNKPIWRNVSNNGWVDAMGTTV